MKAVMDNCKVNKRVRLILGLNEENDWKCINYYKQHEESPTIGFSPDADFPCIYAEKTILTSYLKMNYKDFLNKDIIITNINCNNNPLNVVPKFCSCILKININNISMDNFIHTIKSILTKLNYEIDIYKIDSENIKLTSHGIQAHGAHPDLGINAISRLIIALNIEFFDFFNKFINTEYYGESLNINFEDESGKLTLNVGNFSLQNKILQIGMNIRVPINTPIVDVGNKFLKSLSNYIDVDFDTPNYLPHLYVPKNNYLVQTLCKIYNEETNSNLEPIAIGRSNFCKSF